MRDCSLWNRLTPDPTCDHNDARWHVTTWLPVRVSLWWAATPFGVKHLFDSALRENFKPYGVAELLDDGRRMDA